MRYYRLVNSIGDVCLSAETGEGILENITSVEDEVTDILDLMKASFISGESIDDLTRRILDSGDSEKISLAEVTRSISETSSGWVLDRPFDPPEVWAAGVTYKNSELERRRESDTPDIYSNVYNADRPEVFFKSTSERCMGPFDNVGIRSDSTWDAPEPELAFVIYKGEIVGYTIGNDMSSRSIEGENPLYLPQAKMFDNSCSIGPCFATLETIPNPQDLQVECVIARDEKEVFSGSTSTSEMARTCEEICEWLIKSNFVPDMTTVLTGTSIVPPPDFTLKEGDKVIISIENLGVLENDVIEV
ncbi:MAG TPA: fumarylacetoacetate hydrolase [Dehalococcoidia bacterium]|nr:fumarylacetoacetate hydrolase [Chloroflexota bacterium]HCE75655.1 fumarylacetoacetate hydrolase [Dehalococcoidia bacterium]